MQRRHLVLPILLLSAIAFQAAAQGTLVGKRYPSEQQTVDNAQYGYETIQWTRTGSNNHLYFNIEAFIDDNNFLFFSDRSGTLNLFRMDLRTGVATQMTDETGMVQAIWHWPQLSTAWFIVGKELKEINTQTFATRSVYEFEKARPQSFAVTCDGTYCVFATNKNPGWSAKGNTGPFALFRLDLATKEVKQISPDLGVGLSHVLASPVDPTMIQYGWRPIAFKEEPGINGDIPAKFWWNNVDGTDGGQVGTQDFGLHTTHPCWTSDGKFITYSCRYFFGPKKGRQYIAKISADGRTNVMMEAPVGPAHQHMFSDGRHWVFDRYNGMNLVLFTVDSASILKTEVLFNHESAWKGQPGHPHPRFSPDGKYVLFATDKSGKPQVYTTKVDIGSRR